MKGSIWQYRKYMTNRKVLYPNSGNSQGFHALLIINGLTRKPGQTKNSIRNCVPLSKMPMKKRMGLWDSDR